MSTSASSLVEALRFGRYFNLVTVTSSSILVVFVAALISTGALEGEPSIERVVRAADTADLGDAALIAIATLLVGLLMHPLQFAMVQILEGYWGSNRLSILAMEAAAEFHVRRQNRLTAVRLSVEAHEDAMQHASNETPPDLPAWDRQVRRLRYLDEESDRLLGKYPEKNRILPTALGNRLRAGEDAAGRAWGLDAIRVGPSISLVAHPKDDSYLADATAEVDLGVRLCVVWSLATAASTVLLWRHGWWLLIPVTTYALAYLSYRGSVVAAEEQMAALDAIIALNRFALYERLGIVRPASTSEERDQNAKLMRLLDGDSDPSLDYESDPAATP